MTANVNKWSKTAASNATADPDIAWPEGQAPSTVNNSARGMMEGSARYRDDTSGQLTLAGGTTVYTLTTNSVNSTLQDGLRVHAVVNVACTGASTLNVDGTGAKNIYKATSAGIAANASGDLTVDMHAIFEYDASLNAAAGGWVLLNPYPTATVGVIATFDTVADANQTMASGKVDYTWTTLTAARTATLLAATGYSPGQRIILEDGSGNGSSTVTITATVNPAPGTDTIVGDAVVNSPRGRLELICDGASKFYGKQIRAFGTAAQQAVALDSSAKLPAVDASQLTNIPLVGSAGGRLTLTSGTPVLTATVSAAGTVYWAFYNSQFCPIYNGTVMAMADVGGELSNILANSATGKAGPAAAANNSNYDLFVWNDAGTYRLTRGPLWTSDTGRGTGAGTTELVRVKGVWLNANDITNGPLAQRGTYVGTVRTNGTATVDYIFGALGANGTAGIVGVWNMYNRVNVAMFVQDSTDSWAYTTATFRSANNSATMRVSFISGLAEDSIEAAYHALVSNSTAGVTISTGIGYDATNALAAGCMSGRFTAPVANFTGHAIARLIKPSDLGWHFCQAIEHSAASGATTWYGDNAAPTTTQSGLSFNFRA